MSLATVPARGPLTDRPGQPGLVVAAPGGASGAGTGEIAAELGSRTGFGVVAGADVDREPGPPGREPYERRVHRVARGPLRLLVEILGGADGEEGGPVEIGTLGVDRDEAFQLRTLFELIRDAHLRAAAAAPKLEVRVEPADAVRAAASGARGRGALGAPARALRIALPPAARDHWRELYTAILADFLVQAAALSTAR